MKALLVSLFLIAQGPMPVNQSFGHGVMIRIDGSVVIDEWTQHEVTPGANMPTTIKKPSSITIGKSIKDTVNICFELENGTVCQNVGKLRGSLKK